MVHMRETFLASERTDCSTRLGRFTQLLTSKITQRSISTILHVSRVDPGAMKACLGVGWLRQGGVLDL